MLRSRLSIILVGAMTLAGCSADLLDPVSPLVPSARLSVRSVASTRFLVMAKRAFSSDFTAKVAALGGKVERLHDGAGIALVSGLSTTAAGQLAGRADVADVEADVVIKLDKPVASSRMVAPSRIGIASVSNPAGALLYDFQWNMRLIRADRAWAVGKLGSPLVTVAILDTGIDYDSPDLDGLVDLSRSISFVESDNAIAATYFPTRNRISDFNGHGTNVAQQVSSKAVIFAGVTSRTTLIGVKVLGQDGVGTMSGVLTGLLWAADHGAKVANMSLGGGFPRAGNGDLISLLNRVFNYVNERGMTVVAAAGNAGSDLDHDDNFLNTYCEVPRVICVSSVGPVTAASDPDEPAFYTNFGRAAITVAAPGGNADAANDFPVTLWPWGPDIASWVWSFCSKTTITAFDASGAPITPCSAGDLITGFIGTSQATPHVSGLAALIAAERPGIRPPQVRERIVRGAIDRGPPGQDPFFVAGRIDVPLSLGL